MVIKKVNEVEELQKAFREAGDKPIMVEFYATWCPPCRAIGPKVTALAKKYTKVKVFKVDVDEGAAIARKYRVNSMPTFKIFVNGRAARGGSVVGPSDEELEDLFIKYSQTSQMH